MLNGQVAIVTGASRGIGEAILAALARANATAARVAARMHAHATSAGGRFMLQ
jgi:NAD(P)-dependent dehydrogenase (short-subunit alcohol dehydrogenase family)